ETTICQTALARRAVGRRPAKMPLGFDSVHPGGMNENSPAFQRWDRGLVVSSPKGTAESTVHRPSLRDLCVWASIPSVETLGYFRLSLRDKAVYKIRTLSPILRSNRVHTCNLRDVTS